MLLALPGSAYIYQGEELGLPEVTDIPDTPARIPGSSAPRASIPAATAAGCPSPGPRTGTGFGFSRTGQGSSPAEPWLPQPADWGRYSVESQLADEHSTLNLYRSALRLRRDHPALGRAPRAGHTALARPGRGGLLCFAREPGFILAANLGPVPVPLPAHREVLLASGPVAGGSLPPDTAVWLGT